MKIKIKTLVYTSALAVAFSGCATINDGIVDGIAYTTHSVVGVDYPMKTGKIYIESTTAKDTAYITKYNAPFNGFDTVVAENIMQCDSLPELIDVLMDHGWEITKNRNEADYLVSVSTLYCGYADSWLKASNRNIPVKDRFYYKDITGYSNSHSLGLDEDKMAQQNEEELKKAYKYIRVDNFKNYFNVFDYKYDGAPEKIKKLAYSNIHGNISELKSGYTLSTDMMSKGYGKAGLAVAAMDIIFGDNKPVYAGYETEITIYDPSTKETKKDYFGGLSPLNKNVSTYKNYRYEVDSYASGIFYK